MRSGKVVALVIVACVVAGAGYVFYTPYLTVHQLQRAAREGDVATLERTVDFPMLREDIKSQLNAKVEASVVRGSGSPLASLASTFAQSLVGPMVDMLVTPHAVALMANGSKLLPDRWAPLKPAEPAATRPGAPPAPQPIVGSTATSGRIKYIAHYVAFDRFEAAPSHDGITPEPPKLIFLRQGLAWKLSAIDLGTSN